MFGLFKKKREPGVRPPVARLLKLMASPDGWKKNTDHHYTRLEFDGNIWVYPNGEATWWGIPRVAVFPGNRSCVILPLNKAERRMIRVAGEVLAKRLRSIAATEWEDSLKLAEQVITLARPAEDVND